MLSRYKKLPSHLVLPCCLDGGGWRFRVLYVQVRETREEADKHKLKPTSGLVSGRVNTAKGRWPLVVNIGNSHTPRSRDPRWACGWVSSVWRWGHGGDRSNGEVVGYSGTLWGWCGWVFIKQSCL